MAEEAALGPIGAAIGSEPGTGGQAIGIEPAVSRADALFSDPISPIFNIGGAPIAVLGGVFSGGLPIGGPVTQIFRGGSAPEPPTLFIATITPSGPIGTFFIGSGGAPIGGDTFGGGGLPIGVPPELQAEIGEIEPRTALVGAPAITFGQDRS